MIYTDIQLKEKIIQMIESFESEVVEFKEAKTNYSFNDIGKYFSALSNEANIRGFQEAWLVFGISNDKKFTGTEFRKQGGLQSLKKELVNGTNERLTFLEIYELSMHKCRIIAFQIPPAIRGIPTTWQGAAYAREHESLCPLPMNKVDLIRSQIGMDWSKEIVKEASVEDLDPVAVKKARELFSKRQSDRGKAQEILSKLSDVEVLNKAGITIKGKITRTALLLLGKSESAYFFDGFIPRITWTLYNADNSVKAYEHFDMPMLLAVDKVYNKIRNEKYRYIAGQQTLFPDEVNQYEPELIKEIINNCIAHQDYRMRGKINVEEFEDKLVFINEGAFIPETMGEASKREIMEVLENALPEVLDEGQKSKKVSNLLQAMKKEGLVAAEGKTRHAKWILQQKE
ncbi:MULTISPECIES: RNA-binding domain-containing protein [Eubacteriales]|uniref:ATP-binding protein n=1 Tax=Eubacteriales TaxID=186802 RepID=UPI001106FC8D|nr:MULTISPECIES: RNA-binding domain-containing protein [Eubacteriales]